MMIYMHTINTSPESNNENDDDVIDLKSLFGLFYNSLIRLQI
ncbi:hypothetical protein [Flavobacterium piscis]|jgi:hypothetical protein|nr:hypothetical protein [Flavobacterium piscis]